MIVGVDVGVGVGVGVGVRVDMLVSEWEVSVSNTLLCLRPTVQ